MNRAAMTLALACFSLLEGCIGKDQTIFYTTTNLGVNVQSTPDPVAEVTLSRREGVIEPAFQNGNTQAVVANAESNVDGFWNSLTANGNAMFAGSNAASALGGYVAPADTDPNNAVACLQDLPEGVPRNATGRLFFVTDTSYGFSIKVPTTSTDLPSFHLGYKRNEFASAPVRAEMDGCKKAYEAGLENLRDKAAKLTKDNEKAEATKKIEDMEEHPPPPHAVRTPSFLAMNRYGTANAGIDANHKLSGGAFNTGQLFATGKAAEEVAKNDEVRGSLGQAGAQTVAAAGLTPGPTVDRSPQLAARKAALAKLLADADANQLAAMAGTLGIAATAGPDPTAAIRDAIDKAPNNARLDQIKRAMFVAF